jgi:hypothetical protein
LSTVFSRFQPFLAVFNRFLPFPAVSSRSQPFPAVHHRCQPFSAVSNRSPPFLAVQQPFINRYKYLSIKIGFKKVKMYFFLNKDLFKDVYVIK